MVEFAEKAKEILERIRSYVADKDGWKQAKKTVSEHSDSFIINFTSSRVN
jgi:plasmid stabilization system protein ParE